MLARPATVQQTTFNPLNIGISVRFVANFINLFIDIAQRKNIDIIAILSTLFAIFVVQNQQKNEEQVIQSDTTRSNIGDANGGKIANICQAQRIICRCRHHKSTNRVCGRPTLVYLDRPDVLAI